VDLADLRRVQQAAVHAPKRSSAARRWIVLRSTHSRPTAPPASNSFWPTGCCGGTWSGPTRLGRGAGPTPHRGTQCARIRTTGCGVVLALNATCCSTTPHGLAPTAVTLKTPAAGASASAPTERGSRHHRPRSQPATADPQQCRSLGCGRSRRPGRLLGSAFAGPAASTDGFLRAHVRTGDLPVQRQSIGAASTHSGIQATEDWSSCPRCG
jgi:hypothetical protein